MRGLRRRRRWSIAGAVMMLWGMTLAALAPSASGVFAQVSTPGAEVSMDMTTGQGKTYTLTPQQLDDARDYLYCELVFDYGNQGSDIYSTSPLAPCDLAWWDGLDLAALAKAFGADRVVKNGPQRWSMDTVRVMASAPIAVAGVTMVFGAHLPPGTMGTSAYTVFSPAKYQYLVWDAGKPTYQIVDADGYAYVLQGYKVAPDQLASLGEQFQHLPAGWSYHVVTPDKDLVFDLTPAAPIPSIQDEFDQVYIRVPAAD